MRLKLSIHLNHFNYATCHQVMPRASFYSGSARATPNLRNVGFALKSANCRHMSGLSSVVDVLWNDPTVQYIAGKCVDGLQDIASKGAQEIVSKGPYGFLVYVGGSAIKNFLELSKKLNQIEVEVKEEFLKNVNFIEQNHDFFFRLRFSNEKIKKNELILIYQNNQVEFSKRINKLTLCHQELMHQREIIVRKLYRFPILDRKILKEKIDKLSFAASAEINLLNNLKQLDIVAWSVGIVNLQDGTTMLAINQLDQVINELNQYKQENAKGWYILKIYQKSEIGSDLKEFHTPSIILADKLIPKWLLIRDSKNRVKKIEISESDLKACEEFLFAKKHVRNLLKSTDNILVFSDEKIMHIFFENGHATVGLKGIFSIEQENSKLVVNKILLEAHTIKANLHAKNFSLMKKRAPSGNETVERFVAVQKIDDFCASFINYREALKLIPIGQTYSLECAILNNHIGTLFYELGDYGLALRFHELADTLKTDNEDVLCNIGLDLYSIVKMSREGINYQEGKDKIYEYLKPMLSHENGESGYTSSHIFKRKDDKMSDLEKIEKAYRYLNKAILLNDKKPRAYVVLGKLKIDLLNDEIGALRCFEEAIKLQPDYSEALLEKAKILLKQGKEGQLAIAQNLYVEAITTVANYSILVEKTKRDMKEYESTLKLPSECKISNLYYFEFCKKYDSNAMLQLRALLNEIGEPKMELSKPENECSSPSREVP